MSYVQLSVLDLVIGLGMVAVALLITALQRFGGVKDLVVGTLRAVLQLVAVGFVLSAVFAIEHPGPLLLVLLAMVLVGAHTAHQRAKRPVPANVWIAVAAIAAGSAFVLGYALLGVLRVSPWWSPRYLIPLAGMVIAFCMNTVALASDRLTAELEARRAEVEALLCLGASPRRAAQSAMRSALGTAWTPLVNHLMVVGVVQLPGMMTGQIIAGASPLDAVRYQILIAFMLAAGVAVSSLVAVEMVWRHTFNARAQLVIPPARS